MKWNVLIVLALLGSGCAMAGATPEEIAVAEGELSGVSWTDEIAFESRGGPVRSSTDIPGLTLLLTPRGFSASNSGSTRVVYEGVLQWICNNRYAGAVPPTRNLPRNQVLPAGGRQSSDFTCPAGTSVTWSRAVIKYGPASYQGR